VRPAPPRPVLARPGALIAVVLGVTLLLAGCGPADDGGSTFLANTPESFAVPVADGAEVELVHETGLTYALLADGGRVATPVLFDGGWVLSSGGFRQRFDIGSEIGADALAGGKDLLDVCWGLADVVDGVELPSSGRPGSAAVRCTQSVILEVATSQGYAQAERLLTGSLERLGRDSMLWGWYCHLAGDIAASGAVLAGEDPRTLMREHRSFCDYSVSHGVGAAVVQQHPGDPAAALAEVCREDPAAEIAAFTYTSQCWHGGGMGLARLLRFDVSEGFEICRSAGAEGWVSNCIEGLFTFAFNYSLRTLPGEWGPSRVDVAFCEGVSESALLYPDFAKTCYRNAAWNFADDVRGRYDVLSSSDGASEARRFAESCARADTSVRDGCWAAVGNLAALVVERDLDRPAVAVPDAVGVCLDGGPHVAACLERLLIGLVRTSQHPKGVEKGELLRLLPLEFQGSMTAPLEGWLESVALRGV